MQCSVTQAPSNVFGCTSLRDINIAATTDYSSMLGQWYIMKQKLRSFKRNEHINEKKGGHIAVSATEVLRKPSLISKDQKKNIICIINDVRVTF